MNKLEGFDGHPYMANSNEQARQAMLDAVGATDLDQLFEQIPQDNLTDHEFSWPKELSSEHELFQVINKLLSQNQHCEDNLSFIGSGAYRHYVPAIVDTVIGRSEFLTPVFGTSSSDQGRMQAWFEFTSQLGELLDMEFVGLPVYSYGAAIGHALRMAARVNGRSKVIIPEILDPEKMAVVNTYAGHPDLDGHLEVITCPCDSQTGLIDTDQLRDLFNDQVAAVYFESPNALGSLEINASEIIQLARTQGALSIMGVDPITLGIVRSPGSLDCDICVGSIASLGVHLNSGGGVAGFIASRDEERLVRQFPTLQVSLAETTKQGELGFALTLFEQSSYAAREEGNDWTGNGVYLWAIAASVYMSLLGPEGFREIGAAVLQRTSDLKNSLSSVSGVQVLSPGTNFREVVVSFRESGKSIKAINDALLARGIFGGRDLAVMDSRLEGCALYCVTELHSAEDIDQLVQALKEILA